MATELAWNYVRLSEHRRRTSELAYYTRLSEHRRRTSELAYYITANGSLTDIFKTRVAVTTSNVSIGILREMIRPYLS